MMIWRRLASWFGRPRPRARVLAVLADGAARTGLELAAATGLSAGVLYPTLYALEDRGAITGEWAPGRSLRQRRYRIARAWSENQTARGTIGHRTHTGRKGDRSSTGSTS